MLRLVEAADARAYAARAVPFLRELGEARHALHLGVVGDLARGIYAEPELWFVEAATGALVGLVQRTPPYPAAIALHPDADPASLAAALHGQLPLDAVPRDLVGDGELTEQVARALAEQLGADAVPGLQQRILVCQQLRPPSRQPPGAARLAGAGDLEVLAGLLGAFAREAPGEEPADAAAAREDRLARRLAGDHGIHLWERPDGVAVGTATVGMPTGRGERVFEVYTPPAHRGRGYASALTAHVTAAAFARGCSFVQLLTDRTNLVSNALYERLGYAAVGSFAAWRLVDRQGPKGGG